MTSLFAIGPQYFAGESTNQESEIPSCKGPYTSTMMPVAESIFAAFMSSPIPLAGLTCPTKTNRRPMFLLVAAAVAPALQRRLFGYHCTELLDSPWKY